MSRGETNWPFLIFTARPVRPASTRRSVWRHKNAGICKMSTASAASAAWPGSWMSVRTAIPRSRTLFRIRRPSFNPGPRYDETLERLALSKEALKMNGTPSFAISLARKWTCSSLSMTQGPAISARGASPPTPIEPTLSGDTGASGPRKILPFTLCGLSGVVFFSAVFERRANEGPEQRMRFQRLGFELGMKLAAQIPGMAGQLANFNVDAVGRFAGQAQAMLLQHGLVFAIEFVAMAVAFADLARSVGLAGEAVLGEQARIRAQAHGAAQLIDTLELAQFVDDAVRGSRIEFGGVGLRQPAYVERELDYHGLHALYAAPSESAGHQDAVETLELLDGVGPLEAIGFDPGDVDLGIVRHAA